MNGFDCTQFNAQKQWAAYDKTLGHEIYFELPVDFPGKK